LKHRKKENEKFSELLEPYLKEYMHQSFGMSIKMSRALYKDTEEQMATSYSMGDDYYQRELYEQQKMKIAELEERQQKMEAGQQAQSLPMHTHHAQSLGGLGSAVAGSVFATNGTDTATWATTTGTSDNTLSVSANGYPGMWTDEAEEDVPTKKNKRTNRLTKWFRLNTEYPSDYGNQPIDHEPLDDLRQEMAAWLEDV
jgi:hypothetical protein